VVRERIDIKATILLYCPDGPMYAIQQYQTSIAMEDDSRLGRIDVRQMLGDMLRHCHQPLDGLL